MALKTLRQHKVDFKNLATQRIESLAANQALFVTTVLENGGIDQLQLEYDATLAKVIKAREAHKVNYKKLTLFL